MRIITVEEHLQFPDVEARAAELAGPGPVRGPEFATFVRSWLPDLAIAARLTGARLEHMDRAGVDVQVVSHGAGGPGELVHPEAVPLCRRFNDHLAALIAEEPTRFRGFATLPMSDPAAAAEEFRRAAGDLGFVGALIKGSCDGRFLDDPGYDVVLAAAEELDLPIYVHPGVPQEPVSSAYYGGTWSEPVHFLFSGPGFGWHAEAGVHVLRLILAGALDRHPRLKLLSGHWGEFVAGWLDRLDGILGPTAGLERSIGDTYRQQVWVTPSGMFDQRQLDFVVACVGAERIVYSEDFPYVVRDDCAEFLQRANLDDAQRHAIAHGNAEAIMPI